MKGHDLGMRLKQDQGVFLVEQEIHRGIGELFSSTRSKSSMF